MRKNVIAAFQVHSPSIRKTDDFGMLQKYLCMHKCILDRVFAFPGRSSIPAGTVSWWPENCPAYIYAYKILWVDLPKKNRFEARSVIADVD